MLLTLLALPLRLAAALVAIPTRLSARLLRFSVVTTFRTTRAAVRSSLISLVLGIGIGWFLSTPTGRNLVALGLETVRGRRDEPIDDDALVLRVRAALSAAPSTWHLPTPDVAVLGGVVTLSGTVPHEEGRTDLTSVAATVEGVVSVVDRLALATEADPAPTPSA